MKEIYSKQVFATLTMLIITLFTLLSCEEPVIKKLAVNNSGKKSDDSGKKGLFNNLDLGRESIVEDNDSGKKDLFNNLDLGKESIGEDNGSNKKTFNKLSAGNKKLKGRDYGGAVQEYTKIIKQELDKKSKLKAHYKRGIAYLGLSNSEKAKDDFDIVLKLNSSHADAYFYRGRSKYLLGNKKESLADYTKAIELNPNYTKAYFYRGRLLYLSEKYTDALEDFTKVIELDPNYAAAYISRANTNYFLKNAAEDILADYDKAIELAPDSYSGYYNRGMWYIDRKTPKPDYVKGISDFQQVLANKKVGESARFVAHSYIGKSHYNLGKYANAIKSLNEALKIDPTYQSSADMKRRAEQELAKKD